MEDCQADVSGVGILGQKDLFNCSTSATLRALTSKVQRFQKCRGVGSSGTIGPEWLVQVAEL